MDTQVHGASVHGAISAQIAVGRYTLQIGQPCGATVREAARTERAHIRPRATPIFRRPRLIRGLLDRRKELASALSAIDAGLPIEVSGEAGIGKTALLRHLAHHPRAGSFVDGVVYLSARHQPSLDLALLIFDAFYESAEICSPTEAEVRRGLQEKQALILLDDVHLGEEELEHVLDLAPQSAFVVATRERCLWGEVRSIILEGLPGEDAIALLKREIERSLDDSEQAAATRVCAALGSNPLRIVQAAALARDRAIPINEWAHDFGPESLLTALMATTDDKQRRTLLALAALPGVPLKIQHVSAFAEVAEIEPALMMLVHKGLVISSQSRYRLADGVSDRLRRTDDLKPWANRAITYFTAWAERYRRSPSDLQEESETLLRVQQYAADARRWGEVLQLGRVLESTLVVGARWGAWGASLEHCLAAARATRDRAAEAWALHEFGTRAFCLGEPGKARALLGQAVNYREALHDDAGTAASRANLGLVVTPVTEEPPTRAPLLDVAPVSGSLSLRHQPQRPPHPSQTTSIATLALTLVLSTALGWVGYWAAAKLLLR